MVADAKAVESKSQAKPLSSTLEFRGSFSGREKNVFYYNPEDNRERFVEVAHLLGIDFDDDGRTVVPFDFDGDGDLDLATGSLQNIKILQNNLAPNNFLRLQLQSETGVRQAIGTEVTVYAGGKVQWDYVKATAGFQAQPPLALHFGLGDTKRVDKVQIEWPDGEKTVVNDIQANQSYLIGRKGIIESEKLKRWPRNNDLSQKRQFNLTLSGLSLEGKPTTLAQKNKVTVINFWAPWCEPCKKEIPHLLRLKALYPSIELIGVSVETENKKLVTQYIRNAKMAYKQLYATDEILESFFGTSGKLNLPGTFVFNQKGELRRAYNRPFEFTELSTLLNAITTNDIDISLALTTANFLQSRNRNQESITVLEDALKTSPSSVDLLLSLSKILALTGQHDKALARLNQVVAKVPDHAFAWYARGVIAKSTRPNEVIPSFRKACIAEPSNKQFCTALGAAYFRAKDMKKAQGVFEKLVRMLPKDPEIWINLAKARQLNKAGGAKKALQQALEIAPNNAEAKALIGRFSD